MIDLALRNDSSQRWLYRKDVLQAIAGRIAHGEKLFSSATKRKRRLEVSVLFCDDPFICELNREYRNVPRPTDVLSFEQPMPADNEDGCLGDIVISLETVKHRHGSDRAAMREEVKLLFCHGMLHLLGYDHRTRAERVRMHELQAVYLNCALDAAWLSDGAYQPLADAG